MSLLLPVSRDPADEGTRHGWAATIGAACLPAAASYLVAVAVLAALGAASGAANSVAWVARAAAVGWLAAHHVPLIIDGAPLGVLPLLPTLLLGVLVARGAAGVADRSGIRQPADAGWAAGAIAGIHGILGAVLALVATPATVTADPAQAAVGCALVAGIAAGAGLARPCGLLPAALRQAPGWVQPGLVAGLWGLAVLLTAGFAVVLLGLVVSASEIVQMSGADAGSVLGLIVLSIGYLPNAAIAGLSWLAGPGFSVGTLTFSPITVQAGPVPAVPLLAALPQGPAQSWWVVVLAAPLLVGAAVGRRCVAAGGDCDRDFILRLRVLAVAATVLAVASGVLGAVAGGRLGAAAFDPVHVPFGALAMAVLATTLLGGGAALLRSFPGSGTASSTSGVTATADDGADPDQPDAGDEQADECDANAGVEGGPDPEDNNNPEEDNNPEDNNPEEDNS